MILNYENRTFYATCHTCGEEFTQTVPDDYIVPYDKEVKGYEYLMLNHKGCPSYTGVNCDLTPDVLEELMTEEQRNECIQVLKFLEEVGKEPIE